MDMSRSSIKFGLMITAVVLAAGLAGSFLSSVYREQNSRGTLLPNQTMTVIPQPKALTDFSLIDHTNHGFELASLKGKWSFVFFGFTHCPDICPTTLTTLARVRDKVATQPVGAEPMQFVFISVDPKRDTAARLGQYVKHYDASFYGVSGDDTEIGKLARQLGAAYQVSSIEPDKNDYRVYHTSAVFLVDPLARYHAVFSSPHDADGISKRFSVLRDLERGNTQ